MLNYLQRENDILVRFKKRPLGIIERQESKWVWMPRACDRAVRWEFSSLTEAKKFLEEPSQIVLTRPQ